MIIIISLFIIIIILIIILFRQNQKIKNISQQVNHILFEHQDMYVQQYKEGQLSILESDIVKLVNRLSEQNNLLSNEKLLLKNSLEDISHQIKTPLTSLNLIHERLKNATDKDKRNLLKQQQQLLDKIEWLVISLLKLAQLDADTIIFQKEKINTQDMLQQLIKPFEIAIELKNIQIKIDTNYQYINQLDLLWTIESLSNIFKNSIEHIDENGIIDIHILHNPIYDEIIIQDNGKGINPQDLPHLFERFYKGENATKQSVGIGLALSRMIIEKQNGTITVENTYPGVKFTIHFYHEVI